jgi:hypothetical protein
MMVLFFLFFRSDISRMTNSLTFVSVLCFVSCTLFGFSTLLHVFFMISCYNQLSSRVDIKWFCPMCKETVEKNLKADRQIEEKCRLFLKTVEDRLKMQLIIFFRKVSVT